MTTPKTFKLQPNPFRALPEAEVKTWAGLQETKRVLGEIISSVRPDDLGSSEAIVLYGDWGAGKSHALRYYTHDINKREGLAIYISDVGSAPDIKFAALYPRIIKKIRAMLEKTSNRFDSAVYQAAFSSEAEKKIRDDFDATKKLTSLFKLLTTSDGGNPPYPAVYLFLDEMESIMNSKLPYQMKFYSAIRSLLNEMTEHFALILSFTATLAVLEATIPDYLQARFTRPPYECPPLGSEDAFKEFVRDYLQSVRIEGYSPPQPYYPFAESALDSIFERETSLVPRNVLRHMHAVFERSIHREGLQEGDEISREMAEKILGEMRV